ncbi:hypothetical protein, partial [Nonomuraea maheshkhaliensis]|uniref:hypothetical protein n=1 Tax=Nonomuraea maheshkhaliensis TaxID=419590 RepID=UPI0031F80432
MRPSDTTITTPADTASGGAAAPGARTGGGGLRPDQDAIGEWRRLRERLARSPPAAPPAAVGA